MTASTRLVAASTVALWACHTGRGGLKGDVEECKDEERAFEGVPGGKKEVAVLEDYLIDVNALAHFACETIFARLRRKEGEREKRARVGRR